MKYTTATNAASAITATGYNFTGWNTKADGSGTSYAAGAQVKAANVVPTATTLYAQWTEKTATLTYNANGHGTAPANVTMKYTTATNAASAITGVPGYTFAGWNTKADGTGTSYAAGAQVKAVNVVPTATTLYAQWTPNTAMVTVRKNYEEWTDWDSSGLKVALYQDGVEKYSYEVGTKSGGIISWSGVIEGTYDIYASKDASNLNLLVDTGIDIVVSSSGTATIDYYTLTLQNGIGISAVTGGGTYLKGKTANIDATVAAGYTWEGWSVISGDTPD